MMSPHLARARTLYFLITANLVLVIATTVLTLSLIRTQNRVDVTEQRSFEACLRNNVLREIARFAMTELDSPERAAKPEVQEQDCAAIYPGGVP